LSAEMIQRAQQLNPGVSFCQGDMRALRAPDEAWAAIAALYSIIHIARSEIVGALMELRRVLKPRGVLLLAFHIGDQTVHLDEWWDRQVCVDFYFFQPQEMVGFLQAAGFCVDEVIEREPYPNVEHPSRRAYIFATKPAANPLPKAGT